MPGILAVPAAAALAHVVASARASPFGAPFAAAPPPSLGVRVRSAARIGYSDLSAERARVEQLRAASAAAYRRVFS
jgi:hypothetical protein